ncbi:hypothetical protein KNO15_20925 [Leifsonia shinshuensis]|uniref:hypothetical protein n=1 Tax=Leifsonia shinshuensis TaxID=150026 RepID=UPI001F509415|nr:hypothetical protein [Leifsonia shinshuensis]MCI0159172.1 hypothetical protein [Leifsonia shinshuensis]
MTHRISTFVTAFALAGLAVFLGILQALVIAPDARALTGAGHGPGYLSSDGWWLGTYRMDDGRQGFCLNAGKPSPTGHGLDYAEASALGWYTPQQAASLAYISRSWAGTGDQLTAAAGQIATWLVAGLNGHSPEEVAARAGADAGRVLARAHEMVDEAARRGSNAVRADTVIELAETGPGRVRVELTVMRPSGSDLIAPGGHLARVTLAGASFGDGSTTAEVPTGTDVEIMPTATDASVTVSAHAEFSALPYGDRMLVAVPHDDAQAVLIAVPATAEAHAEASATGPSPLPFQPVVATVTSTAVAAPGAAVHDRLTVTVDTEDGLLPSWGVRATDDGFEPVDATVESTLHGPFDDPIVESAAVPEGSPVVCVVETAVNGTGEYETPECTLPAAGYYVWTERIDPAAVEPDAGGERIRPWQSAFGIASEITLVAAPAQTPPAQLAATGDDSGPRALALAGSLVVVGCTIVAIGHIGMRRVRRPTHRRA